MLQLDPNDVPGAHNAVNIKRIVLALRKQRPGMVQTVDQYLFCYLVRTLPFTPAPSALVVIVIHSAVKWHA